MNPSPVSPELPPRASRNQRNGNHGIRWYKEPFQLHSILVHLCSLVDAARVPPCFCGLLGSDVMTIIAQRKLGSIQLIRQRSWTGQP